MIEIYSPGNVNFEKNGDMTLTPTECLLDAEGNGTWVLNITHPLDPDGRWEYIEAEGTIAAPTFLGRQLFTIHNVEKTDTGISAEAYPVFFNSKDEVFIKDTRPENKTGQEALNLLTAGTKYSGESDITRRATAYFERRSLLAAIQGEDEPTFLSRWGGEIVYDNFKIIINEKTGSDHGVEISYGKNMTGLSYEEDMSDVVTSIIPVAYNGRSINGTFDAVDSPLIGKYSKKYIKEITFDNIRLAEDGEGSEGDIICQTQAELNAALKKASEELFASGIDKPAVSVEVKMADLSKTEEYKNFSNLEKVSLWDEVSCKNKKLGINVKTKVVRLVWDCIQNRSEEIYLGAAENVVSAIKEEVLGSKLAQFENAITDDGDILGQRIIGFINGARAQLRAQQNIAQKQEIRAAYFEDLDPNSPNFGALSIGTQGIQISKKRNADNTDWVWTTAMTFKGLIADIIVAGIIADKTGQTSWNLDTGELKSKQFSIDENGNAHFSGELKAASGTFSGTVKAGTIDGGTIKGTTITGGNIDGTKITAGTFELTFEKTYYAKNYTEADAREAEKIVVGTSTLTKAKLEKYDINGDGKVTSIDALYILKMANGQQGDTKVTWKATITGGDRNKIIKITRKVTSPENNYAEEEVSTIGTTGFIGENFIPLNAKNGRENFGIRTGEADIYPKAANEVTSYHVPFQPPYKEAPHVIAGLNTTVPNICRVSTAGVTKDGFDIYLVRENTTTTGVRWFAFGQPEDTII